jgi:Domain of unknown function (DUF1929)
VRTRRRTRVRAIQMFVGVVAIAGAVAVNGPPLVKFVTTEHHKWLINTKSYKQKYGHWSTLSVPSKMRVNAVHAAMLYTGKVLIIAGSGNNIDSFKAGKFVSLLWDPQTDTFKKLSTPTDLFCGGHAFLPDGKVLIAGGTGRYEYLKEQVHLAAGVMTVTNASVRDSTILAKGTLFRASNGTVYKSIADTAIPAAKSRALPSSTPLWVQAMKPGSASVSRIERRYAVQGLAGAESRSITAAANRLTLDQQDFWGSRDSYIFDPASERYTKVANMNLARWYPTLVTLADGRVLSVSGLDQFGRIIVGTNEVWSPQTHRWSVAPELYRQFPTYPSLFLMPSGDLFFSGSSTGFGPDTAAWRTPGIWNLKKNTFKPVLGMRDPNMAQTSGSVLLAPAQAQRYAIVGGGGTGDVNTATGRIDVANLNSKRPRWRPAARLSKPTRYPELVITPDDNLLISGGSSKYRGQSGSDLLECHLFDPRTGKLTRLADPTVGRDYHAEALLLPDGRILTSGGNPLFGDKKNLTPGYFEQRISIFTPPYLYHGPRPRITGGPQQLARGQTGLYTTPDSASIKSARLMRPGLSTHVQNPEQRSVALGVEAAPGGVRLTVPRGAGLVPSGWYMLFLNNTRGVPSLAYWVRVV